MVGSRHLETSGFHWQELSQPCFRKGVSSNNETTTLLQIVRCTNPRANSPRVHVFLLLACSPFPLLLSCLSGACLSPGREAFCLDVNLPVLLRLTLSHPRRRRALAPRLHGIYHICGTRHAFAALRHDGSVVTWGSPVPWQEYSMSLSCLWPCRTHVQKVLSKQTQVHGESDSGLEVLIVEASGGDSGSCSPQLQALALRHALAA